MALLLDDLLDVARITQGKLEIRRQPVRLATVIDAAVEAARPLIEAKRHSFEAAVPASLPPVQADPLRLAQVLLNLLGNAAKYTDPGGHITLTAGVDGGEMWVAVRDDGIGIPHDSLDRVFGMFSQLDSAGPRTEGGLGIGLALVRGLIVLHGGRVTAHSDGLGRGSTFVVHLPLDSVTTMADDLADRGPQRTCEGGRLRILVVDDNRDAADSLAMLLGLSGHEVQVAYDGQGALAAAARLRPHVALLDIGLPDMDGYAVARALRATPGLAPLKLYAVTGWGHGEHRERALSAGFDDHLTKPVDPERLEDLIAADARALAESDPA
jgi:CheY-like chemotaxis protein